MATAWRCSRPLRSSIMGPLRFRVSSKAPLPPFTQPQHFALRCACRRSFGTTLALHEKRYTKDHEWIELSSDGKTGTIGISTYAAKSLGDVVYVELPTPDLEVSAGDTIGAVESVKSASDILTPVSGKIIEGNAVLEEKPGTINKGPEEEGWIARIEVSDAAEVEGLMGGEEYEKFTEE